MPEWLAGCITHLAVLGRRHPLNVQLWGAAIIGAAQQPIPVPVPVEAQRRAPRVLALPRATLDSSETILVRSRCRDRTAAQVHKHTRWHPRPAGVPAARGNRPCTSLLSSSFSSSAMRASAVSVGFSGWSSSFACARVFLCTSI